MIHKEAKYITIFVKFHVALSLITGCILIPIGKERKFHFILTFLEDYYHLSILEAFYYIIFPVSALVSIRLPQGLLYIVSYIKFVVYEFLDSTKAVFSIYESKDDNELLESKEYQSVVRGQLVLAIVKINELIK